MIPTQAESKIIDDDGECYNLALPFQMIPEAARCIIYELQKKGETDEQEQLLKKRILAQEPQFLLLPFISLGTHHYSMTRPD